MNMMGRKYTMKRNYLMHLIQLVVIFTSIWISLQATQAATIRNVPSAYATITLAIADAIDGDTINVAGRVLPYAENIIIGKSLVLQGAGAATTIISGTGTIGSSIITITASNVTIDGFKITNAASKRGISVANQSGITITNNTITAIDGSDATTTSENTFGIAVSSSSAAVANITITNNIISNISNANASGSRSTHGIVAGFSDGNFHITNLLIQGNSISTKYRSKIKLTESRELDDVRRADIGKHIK